MARKTKAEALETRKAILEAAEQVFFDRGVARTSLEEVAKAAGVTRGAVYWHFRNKADLFEAIHEQVSLPMHDVFYRIIGTEGEAALAQLESFCAGSLLQLHEDDHLRRIFTVLLLKCESSEEMDGLLERQRLSKEETTESLTRFFEQLRSAGCIRARAEPRVLALALHAYMLGLYVDYLRAPSSYRMPEDARALVGHFFASLRAEEAPARQAG